ncbi:MAG: FkbM family methyltransferase [Rhodospirillaceae bacterium]|nr:FkbM family methyltransferase [Rhodospirillaceae bacterium]MBT5940100.1 FkbM family methyltransferase [Rhodospirillaceae bacterium]MBT7268495.1 FkbM family methyltransferase [Rhodospirillaceae bacterium]
MTDTDLTLAEYERMIPTCQIEHNGHTLKFYTPSEHVKALVETMFVQEPETIEWIAEFDAGDVFVDIGANIGLYALWATISQDVQSFAFEPEALNYSILIRNILNNNLGDRLVAYPVAISDQPGFDKFHLTVFEHGESCHVFGEKIDYNKQPIDPVISQGCYATTIDELVASGTIPLPNHLKIDVDGIEPKVIAGAKQTLQSPDCRSLLIEINDTVMEDLEMIYYLQSLGFKATSAPPSVLAPIPSVHNVVLRRED